MLDGFGLWVALTVGVLLATFLILSRWHYLSLAKLPADPGDRPLPDCMVVIPARNEEALIGVAVQSLPHDTVIVVDDASEDGTAEVARKSGAGVIPAPALPEGSMGKANACQAAARVLTSKWILFTDADVQFKPGFVNAAVACAEANGLAFLSIYPRMECATLEESILSPYAAALFFCGVSNTADPASVFNGQCMLVRREAYEFIGAHAAVMHSLSDDVKFAGLARRHRLKFASVRAESLAQSRFREPFLAIRRGAFRFMLVRSWMGVVILGVASLAALWLPVLIWISWNGVGLGQVLFAVLPVFLTMPWYRNPLKALAAPIAIYAILPTLWAAFFAALNGSRVEWKKRLV